MMLAQSGPSSALMIVLGILFVVNAFALIAFVLFRQGDSGGIGAAFGGGDGGGALGTKGQAVADRVIAFMGGCFVVLALAYSLISTSGGDETPTDEPAAESTDKGE